MNILFVDNSAYKAYDLDKVHTEALGGSEATMLRVASGLATRGHNCYLFQTVDSQRETAEIQGITHIGVNSQFHTPDIVVHFRLPSDIPWAELYPNAKHFMWLQDLGGTWFKEVGYDGKMPLVCTSKFHAHQVRQELKALGMQPPVTHLYNPVCTTFSGRDMAKVPNRLGFFSSPHKGLLEVINHFVLLREKYPDLELVVGNPGYIKGEPLEIPDGIRFLGELPHFRAMEEMGQCSMLFYPQTTFPEAFGIVMAEANALGIPVLTHRFGASKEVCDGLDAIVDCKEHDNVLEGFKQLHGWAHERTLKPDFAINNVLNSWETYIEALSKTP